MTFLPVAHRELLAASRRPGMRRVRVVSAIAAAGAAFLVVLLVNKTGAGGQLGRWLFNLLSWCCAFMGMLGGALVTSDALAVERRDGTLGFLFLTELDGVDVVAGKLVAHGLNALYALAGVFPVLALGLFLGGVSAAEFWRTTAALLNGLFVGTATGLAVSSACHEAGRATWMAVFATAWLNVGMPMVAKVVALATGSGAWLWAGVLSPGLAFIQASEFKTPAGDGTTFLATLMGSHVAGWVLLAFAAWKVGRGWRQAGDATPRRRRRRVGLRWLERDPVRALMEGRGIAPAAAWGMAALGWAGGVVLLLPGLAGPGGGEPSSLWILSCAVALMGMVAWEATAFVSEARRDGSLELLLATPLLDSDFKRGLAGHMKGRFLGPVLLLAAAVVVVGLGNLGPIWGVVFAVGMVVQWQAMPQVGLWFALTERRPAMAFLKTFGGVVVAGTLLQWACCIGLAIPPLLNVWTSHKLSIPLRDLVAGVRSRWERRNGWWVARPLHGGDGSLPPWRDPRPPNLPYQRRPTRGPNPGGDAS